MNPLHPPHHLVDPEAATEIFRRADLDVTDVRPDYIRHKPGETTIVSYLFRTGSGDDERGYAQWCADVDRADEIHRKAATLRLTQNSIGAATLRLDPNTILYPFPNDARLRRLRWYTTPRKLKRTLGVLAPTAAPLSGKATAVRVLRYKPERRVVVAADLAGADGARRPVLVRYATARQAGELAATAHSLRQHGVRTPRPLLQLDEDRVSVDEFIIGVELRSATRDRTAAAHDVAEAVERFHATPSGTSRRTAVTDLHTARSGLTGLAAWSGDLAETAEAVGRELERTLPDVSSDDVLLHGDLHDKNLMITPAGDVAFVDLERCARGPAEIDLGRLRGVVRGMGVRQPGWSPDAAADVEEIIERYRVCAPDRIDRSALAWHTATALVDQALLVARHLEPDWLGNATTLLESAMVELAPVRAR